MNFKKDVRQTDRLAGKEKLTDKQSDRNLSFPEKFIGEVFLDTAALLWLFIENVILREKVDSTH